MSTAVAQPSPAEKASPLSDSLMSMIDEAHAEPVKAESGGKVEPASPPSSPSPLSTPATGKAADPKTDTPAESGDAPVKDAAGEAKPEKVAPKKEPDQADVFKKRLNEQTAVNSRLGRELKEAQEKIKVLEQQIAGTYQPPAEPSDEDKAKIAEFRGKEIVGRKIASEKYGESFVNSQIYDDGSPYQQLLQAEPEVHIAVAKADNPVEEALRVLGWRTLQAEHGHDPDQFVKSLTEKIRAELTKEYQKQQADASVPTGKEVPSVGEARGAAEGREPVKVEEEFSLSAMGSHFLD